MRVHPAVERAPAALIERKGVIIMTLALILRDEAVCNGEVSPELIVPCDDTMPRLGYLHRRCEIVQLEQC